MMMMLRMSTLLALLFVQTDSFHVPVRGINSAYGQHLRPSSSTYSPASFTTSSLSLYDEDRTSFDLLSLSNTYSRKTLNQYSSTNQSEPIRIILTFLAFFTFTSLPLISSDVGLPQLSQPEGIVACSTGAAASLYFFLRNRSARTKQLNRIDKEYRSRFLPLTVSSPFTQSTSKTTVGQWNEKGGKLVAIYGNEAHVRRTLNVCRAFR